MNQHGFSLIELLVALFVMSILALTAMPLAEMAVRHSKEEMLRDNLKEIRHALDSYKAASEKGHIELVVGSSGYPAHLQDLVRGVPDTADNSKTLYFLRRIPRDPFSSSTLTPEQSWGLRSYESSAENPRPGADVYDVYSTSKLIASDGSWYRDW